MNSRLLTPSLDHLVGAGEEQGRDRQIERLSRPEVDHKLKPCRELNGQVARRAAVQYLMNERGGMTKAIEQINAIADQAALHDMLAIPIDHWQALRGCQLSNLPPL